MGLMTLDQLFLIDLVFAYLVVFHPVLAYLVLALVLEVSFLFGSPNKLTPILIC